MVGSAKIYIIMEKENNWGGKREGAGRKSKDATFVGIRLDQSLYDLLIAKSQARKCSKTEIIEDALTFYFEFKK